MDPLTVAELVDAALATDDQDVRQEFVSELHRRESPETFGAGRALMDSDDPERRRLAAEVLAQIGAFLGRTTEQRRFRPAAVPVLLRALERETDPDALAAIVVALGHLWDDRAVGPVAALRRHEDQEVREAVAFTMTWFETLAAADSLIELSEDEDEAVRSWATFGLGQEERVKADGVDAGRVRAALLARLGDEDEGTQAEAVMGLARAGDPVALDPIVTLLAQADPEADRVQLEEAAMLLAAATGDPRLCEHVTRIHTEWLASTGGPLRPEFDTALRRCLAAGLTGESGGRRDAE